MKHECGSPTQFKSRNPDSFFCFADRLIVFDHELNEIYFVCLVDQREVDSMKQAENWQHQMQQILEMEKIPLVTIFSTQKLDQIEFTLHQNHQTYLGNRFFFTKNNFGIKSFPTYRKYSRMFERNS